MEIIKSNKGKNMISYDEYIYLQSKKMGNKIYWKCQNSQCRATAITALNYLEDYQIKLKNVHNHNQNYDLIEGLKIKNRIKENSVNNFNSVNELIVNEIGNSSRAIISYAGSADSLIQMVQYNRERNILNGNIFVEELGLTEEMTKTFRDTAFYQYGPSKYLGLPEYDEVIILFAEDIRHELYNNFIWCIDGTFAVSPSGYAQVYTIGILRNHHVIPIVYGILKNKIQ